MRHLHPERQNRRENEHVCGVGDVKVPHEQEQVPPDTHF